MRPKLAFISLWDAANRNAESGYAYSMRTQLQKNFEVIDLFPLGLPFERFFLPLRAAYKLAGRYYHPMREPSILKTLAYRISKALRSARPDVIFAPSSVPVSYVDAACPIIYATDQLFCDFVETYIPSPSERFVRLGEAQEKRTLRTASRATFPSTWAAQSAAERYGADPAKIDVIPWGANLPQEIPDEFVQNAISSRTFDVCRLVFIGRDWKRKGGDLFVETVRELIASGVRTQATIVGCAPQDLPAADFEVHPFLDKGCKKDFAVLVSILSRAHFFFLLSRAEAYGQAFCEAAAFGVPSIGSNVGGIPTIIRDNDTGFLQPPDASPRRLAQLIRDTLADRGQYLRMARRARQDYLDRLNWNSFGNRLTNVVMSAI